VTLYLAVQARRVRCTNHVDRTNLGPEVAVTTLALVSVGTHRGKAIVDELIRIQGVYEVVGSRLFAVLGRHQSSKVGPGRDRPDLPAGRPSAGR
jgi:hypothetical protein